MSTSPPKRPRLSLQIKTPATAVTFGKSSTALKADIDPKSPTAFNTLSNAYAAAIENSSPRTARPLDSKSGKPTTLRLETKNFGAGEPRGDPYVHPSQRTQTPGPFSIVYPDTPCSAIPGLTLVTALSDTKATDTSFTFTPPQSAGPTDHLLPRVFTFEANVGSPICNSPRTPRRRATIGSQYQVAPYTHPRSLHSILRNSPLPPRATQTPATPSRSSLRLANRAAKKVGYNDPLTQTITTNKYIKSHIDLLAEDSPRTAVNEEDTPETFDFSRAFSTNETRDGGRTPGAFEEMRRRMAESDLETPGARKRKRKEKKRKWEWTITNAETEGDEENSIELPDKTPVTAIRITETPSTAFDRGESVSTDSEMSEEEGRYVPDSTDSEMSDSDQRPGTSQSL